MEKVPLAKTWQTCGKAAKYLMAIFAYCVSLLHGSFLSKEAASATTR